MRTLFATLLAFWIWIPVALTEITLDQIDSIRAPEGDFAFIVTTESAGDDPLRLEVLVKDSRRSLVRYVEPKGRTLLFVDQDMWVYIAGSRRELRISPRQRLLGGAATADVARLFYADDYAIDAVYDAGNGERTLTLVKKTKKAAYARIELTVEGDKGRPTRAVHYASTGDRAIKTAYFEDYRPVLGRDRPTRFRIVDHLNGDAEITLIYSDFRLEETPENWFNPAYLKRLR